MAPFRNKRHPRILGAGTHMVILRRQAALVNIVIVIEVWAKHALESVRGGHDKVSRY